MERPELMSKTIRVAGGGLSGAPVDKSLPVEGHDVNCVGREPLNAASHSGRDNGNSLVFGRPGWEASTAVRQRDVCINDLRVDAATTSRARSAIVLAAV